MMFYKKNETVCRVIRWDTLATNYNTYAHGYESEANGIGSYAFGGYYAGDITLGTISNGISSFSFGTEFTNNDNNSFAIGFGQKDFSVDSNKTYIKEKLGIGTTSPAYPLVVDTNISGISIYADGNVSASGYITRTKVFDKNKDKEKGNTKTTALEYIKDAEEYYADGEINHEVFEYSKIKYNKKVLDHIEIKKVTKNICTTEPYIDDKGKIQEKETCEDITYNEQIPIYETIEETGILLDDEVALLKQAIYELKMENEMIKTELCAKDNKYEWCE